MPSPNGLQYKTYGETRRAPLRGYNARSKATTSALSRTLAAFKTKVLDPSMGVRRRSVVITR